MSKTTAVQPRVLFVTTDNAGGMHYRMRTPAKALQETGFAHTLCHGYTYDADSIKALAPDVVVFQHPTTDQEIQTLRTYRKALSKAFFVYDIDDNFWAVPEESIHYAALPPDIKLRIVTAANLCNRITCATAPLAAVMREATTVKDIQVLPNFIGQDELTTMTVTRRKTRSEHQKPRVGWAGGIGHGGDIKLLEPIVNALQDQVTFVFIGMTPDLIDKNKVEIHEVVPIHLYHEKLATLDLDLALAPLATNTFNTCKSNLRLLEYGACGYPVIASDVVPYDGFPTVQTLPFRAPVWETAIRELLRNPAKLEELSEQIHTEVNANWNAEKNAEVIAKAYMAPKAAVYTPRISTPHAGVVACTTEDISDAVLNYPTHDILWATGTTDFRSEDLETLQTVLKGDAVASVSAFTNDGVYPVNGQFVRLTENIISGIREAAVNCGNAPFINIPHPVGPAVLLKASVLAKIGAPDVKRFGSRAVALLDWGARANKIGYINQICPHAFAYTHEIDKPVLEVQDSVQAVQGWSPEFTVQNQQSDHMNHIEFAAQNIELIFNKNQFLQPITSQAYADWLAVRNALTPSEIEAMDAEVNAWESQPLISVLMPVYNPPLEELKAAIASVEHQIYPHWELVMVDDCSTNPAIWAEMQFAAERDARIKIKRREANGHICATSNDAIALMLGDWFVCLDHDDTIEPHALYAIAETIKDNPDVSFIYSDSDKISPEGNYVDPYFVSDFNYDLLLAQNYVTHLSAYKVDQVVEIAGYREGFEGSQDWDMTLRYLTHTCGFPIDRSKIIHIPQVLYHWRQSENSASRDISTKPYAIQAGRQAVLDHLKATGQQAVIGPNQLAPVFNMVRGVLGETHPMVSIIIQTKDNPDQLGKCINSIIERTSYNNYEIIVLDNGWRKTALKKVISSDKVTLVANPGDFNYAAANNKGAELAQGEVLCFLNDDTEIIEVAWLLDMVSAAQRSWTGAVGARLIYSNGVVQQNGTIIDMDAPAGQKCLHAFQGNQLQNPGTVGRGALAAEWSAVTGACMVISKAKYLEVGGMDAEEFPTDYNDVDLCLRLMKAGYRNVVVSHILVIHHEGQTKKDSKAFTAEAVLREEAKLVARHGDFVDPYRNMNLSHSPNLDMIQLNPIKLPWQKDVLRERILVINGDHGQSVDYYQDGYIAFCATLAGHNLYFTYPRMDRVAVLDTRDVPADLLYIVQMLGVTKIILNGIGEGTFGILGHLQEVQKYGVEVEFNCLPTDKEETLPEPVKAYLWAVAKGIEIAEAA